MTVTRIFWRQGAGGDIHLLPGLVSPRLDQLLMVEDDDTGTVPVSTPPTGVSVTFEAFFVGAPSNFGVTLNAHTGEVTIRPAFPPGEPRLRTFQVVARVHRPDDSDLRVLIRFYVHERLESMWLTPDPLTVRHGSVGTRFSVLATFDDHVVCDISNWSPFTPPDPGDLTFVHVDTETDPVHIWSSNSVGITIDQQTGVMTSFAEAGEKATITVVRGPTPPGAPDPIPASGTALGGPVWATPVTVTRINGPGFTAMHDEKVRNILLLPDGFTDDEKSTFEALAHDAITALTQNSLARPFDLLTDNFNWMMAWVASRQQGISVLPELDPDSMTPGMVVGDRLVLPEVPANDTDPLTLEGLIDTVGLPSPMYESSASVLVDPDDANRGLLPYWKKVFDPTLTEQRTSGVFAEWLALADRVVANERDTAFGLAFGVRPNITDGPVLNRSVGFHPRRATDNNLDTFLGALTSDGTTTIGDVWVTGNKDDKLVVFLCRINHNGGSNNGRGQGARYMGITLNDEHVFHWRPAVHGVDLEPDDPPKKAAVTTWTTIAHEVAHSFDLVDEYGGGGVITTHAADDLSDKFNAQPRRELLVAGHLNVSDLKWRWRRLVKAGIVAAKITDPRPGPYTVTMRPGHAAQFGVNDVVRFRDRQLEDASFSGRLVVIGTRSGDRLVLRPLDSSSFDPGDFEDGSLLVRPLRADDPRDPKLRNQILHPTSVPDEAAMGDDLELVASSVIDRINATHNPLNARGEIPATATTPAQERDPPDTIADHELRTPTKARNFVGRIAPKPPRFSSWYVGVFDNADAFDSRVYRPTGICMMRRRHFFDKDTKTVKAYQFCPVCRYAMVDDLDPTKHGIIDADFAPRYPT